MKKDNYEKLFKMEGKLTIAHSEFFLKGSLRHCNPLILHDGTSWHSFMSKEKKEICLKKGSELLGNEENYRKFAQEFREYLNTLKSFDKDINTKEDLALFFTFISELWEHYGYTEYVYTDGAYDKSKKWLQDDFGKLKLEGREGLNSVIYDDGLLIKVLRKLSKKFLNHEEDAFFLYTDELLGLFDNLIPSKELLEERKVSYGMCRLDDGIIRFDHKTTLNLIEELISAKRTEKIKGIIANNGKVIGRAVIAPMLVDKREIQIIIDKMKQNDILVAQSTTPEFMELIKKAAGIIADQGGMLSHAAIVSREFDIPCIVGTEIGTQVFEDGDLIELDADSGIARRISE